MNTNVNQEHGLPPVLGGVISSFAPHLPAGALPKELWGCSVKSTMPPTSREQAKEIGWDTMSSNEQLAWQAGYSFAAKFAHRQYQERLESFRRTLGEATASAELLFRQMSEDLPL